MRQRRNNNNYRGRGRRGNNRGRRDRRDPERGTAQSGNLRERISVESGYLVLIDQFMLANHQFVEKLSSLIDADPSEKDLLVRHFGGEVIQLNPGLYRIERDPFATSILIHPEGQEMQKEERSHEEGEEAPSGQASRENAVHKGTLAIDTRCLAMIDRELLDDSSLIEKYQQLWFDGQDKACRDLLRDNGGAVRYGFQRNGDTLGVYSVDDESVVWLWPQAA